MTYNSAEAFASAARVVASLQFNDPADINQTKIVRELDRLADLAKNRDAYIEDLGMFADDLDRHDSSYFNGTQLVVRLLGDGWTPPNGVGL